MTSLTVLIPTHGRPTLLGRTLASLGACRLPDSYSETVVVENGSRAGAEAIVAEAAEAHPHLRLRYMHVERANKSHALNEALRTVEGGLVVFFDDDVRLDPDVLEAYTKAASEHPQRSFFGGPLECAYEQRPVDWLIPYLPFSATGFTLSDARRKGYFLGANWAAWAGELRAMGGFNPEFGPGSPSGARGQEKNMQLRMREAGHEGIGVADAIVHHHVPSARCSPEWAIQRRHQIGIQQGRLASAESTFRPFASMLVGLPRRALSVAKRTSLRDEVGRFQALAALKHDLGFVSGFIRDRLSRSERQNSIVEDSSDG